MRDYKKPEVWNQVYQLYLYVKKSIVMKFAWEEKYELASLLQRAVLSVPLNIAEGCGRYTEKDFAHFLNNALGSLNETDYCCFAASELKYTSTEEYGTVKKLINETRAMLIAFIKFLRR
jgi:four helix bundle protein